MARMCGGTSNLSKANQIKAKQKQKQIKANQSKSKQIKANQSKSKQIKANQSKSKQIKANQIKAKQKQKQIYFFCYIKKKIEISRINTCNQNIFY